MDRAIESFLSTAAEPALLTRTETRARAPSGSCETLSTPRTSPTFADQAPAVDRFDVGCRGCHDGQCAR